ncbi:hypothetical protein Poli38472_007133 [Pythium oligandrum]|uniref:Uncharacterized protein n=1 Tax=Pythium oligandrum TaxID=41045 RepID=A0A8K1CA73_PYTOL|nr:hypothetical protein Poli38472_007133 [Pythium oligandrum]|eukprot:TMW58988.1 hypothetical protein Poli38472_007133 [Pythium oligandrum]
MDVNEEVTSLDPLLAFLDGCDGDVGGSNSPSDGSKPCESKRGRSGQQRHQRSGEKQETVKHELARLRQEADELQAQMEHLKRNMLQTHGRKEYAQRLQSFEERMRLVRAWKRIVARHFDRRRAAEEENDRLKRQILKQRLALTRFQRAMQQELVAAMIPTPAASSRLLPSWTTTSDDSDPRQLMSILAELLANMKAAYDDTGALLQTAQSLCSKREQSGTRLVPLSSNQVMVEVFDIRVVPFEFHAVGECNWNLGVKSLCSVKDLMREVTEVDGRETIFSTQLVGISGSTILPDVISLRRHASFQRFFDKERAVIVQSGRSQSVHSEDSQSSGLTLTETHWSVFQPSGTGNELCLLTSSSRYLLQIERDLPFTKDGVSSTSEYFTTHTRACVDAVVTHVEDQLLEQCL